MIVGVRVMVGVSVMVGVNVAVGVEVAVGVSVGVALGVLVGVLLGVGVGLARKASRVPGPQAVRANDRNRNAPRQRRNEKQRKLLWVEEFTIFSRERRPHVAAI